MRLTKSRVEALPIPKTGQSLFWDEDLRGFGIRVTASGARSYIAQGRVNGKSRRITLGAHGRITCDQARKKAKSALVALDDGLDPQVEKKRAEATSVTLREIAAIYCKERRTTEGGSLAPRTKSDILKHINKSFSSWADIPVASINRDMCSDHFIALSSRGATQANAAFRYLRALLNFACEAYRPGGVPVLLENPVSVLSGKKMWNPNKAKDGRIPLEQVGAVWNLLNEQSTSDIAQIIGHTAADIIAFIMLTGCRWSEAAELTWERVNLDASTWHIAIPKNRKPITLPMSTPVRELLQSRPRLGSIDFVFTARGKSGHINDARHIMVEVSKVAGLHLTPHDLRRTFISIGIKNNIEMWKLKLLTSHISKGDVTQDHYIETKDLRYLSVEAEQIAMWVLNQSALASGHIDV